MRFPCYLALVAALLACCPQGSADALPSDPGIILHGGGGSTSVGFTFGFSADSSGSVSTAILQNGTDVTWFNLLITTVLPASLVSDPLSDFTCTQAGTIFFAGCTLSEQTSGDPTILSMLYAGSPLDGIGPGVDFSLTGSNWGADETFSAQANVPEPTTLLLWLSGLILAAAWWLGLRRKPLLNHAGRLCAG